MMSDRNVWAKAGAIVSSHGTLTAGYITDQMRDALGDRIAVEDWRRVAAAVDAIKECRPQ